MLGLDLGALAAVPVVRWVARDLRMPPPPHLGIMAPFATLSHGARSLPVFSAPPISGPGGTPVRRRGTLFCRQPDTGHSEHPWIKPTSPTPSKLPGTRPGSRTTILLRRVLVSPTPLPCRRRT